MRYAYPCELTCDVEGGWDITFPDIPGAQTCGWSKDEALAMGADLLHCLLAWSLRDGQEIPEPSSPAPGQVVVAVPAETAAKAALHHAMRDQGITVKDLAKRLGIPKQAASKVTDVEHYSRMDQVEAALAAVGLTLAAEVTARVDAPAVAASS